MRTADGRLSIDIAMSSRSFGGVYTYLINDPQEWVWATRGTQAFGHGTGGWHLHCFVLYIVYSGKRVVFFLSIPLFCSALLWPPSQHECVRHVTLMAFF